MLPSPRSRAASSALSTACFGGGGSDAYADPVSRHEGRAAKCQAEGPPGATHHASAAAAAEPARSARSWLGTAMAGVGGDLLGPAPPA